VAIDRRENIRSNNQLAATVEAHPVLAAVATEFDHRRKQEEAIEVALALIIPLTTTTLQCSIASSDKWQQQIRGRFNL